MTVTCRWLCCLFVVACCWLGVAIHLASAANNSSLITGATQFLPVEVAYTVNPHIEATSLVLDWTIAPGYYLYRDRFSFSAVLSDGAGLPITPVFEGGERVYDEYYQKDLEVYYRGTRVILPFAVPPGKTTVTLVSQGCADAGLCYPPRTQIVEVNFDTGIAEVIAAPPAAASPTPPVPPGSDHFTLATLLLFALLGGIILNLMPCVFPVLAIKALRVVNAHSSPRGKHRHSLAYALGVVLSFVMVAGVLMILRATGEAVGWGFQLQHPVFVSFLALLFFVTALGFSGRFAFGARLMNLGQAATEGNSLSSSFMTGVLATVAASPCTAPFMGTALGAALMQPPALGLLIFAALGVGMALPFLLLTWIPGLARILPRPGPWMEVFREFLAFPLYLTVIWLLWLLGRQTGVDRVLVVGLGLLLIAFAIWIHSHARGPLTKALALGTALIAVALPLAPTSPQQQPFWEPYTSTRLNELRAQGRPVLVNLTADWCITCLANERVALSSHTFRQTLTAEGIYYLKGDWTNNNPEITTLLTEYGRSGVPLYLFFPRGLGPARVLPQLLTPATVLAAISGGSSTSRE